jgi:hypothetical protein
LKSKENKKLADIVDLFYSRIAFGLCPLTELNITIYDIMNISFACLQRERNETILSFQSELTNGIVNPHYNN